MAGLVSGEELRLKVNLNDLVERFEREFGPIGNWMSGLAFNQRVELVKAQLLKWLDDMEIEEPEPEKIVTK